MIKTCIICGREFEARKSDSKVCGDECRRTYHNQYNARWKWEHYRKTPEPERKPPEPERKPPEPEQKPPEARICAHCGKEFIPGKFAKARKYCSDKCKDEHNAPKRKEYQKKHAQRKLLEAAAEKAEYIEKNNRRTHLDDVAAEAKTAGMSYGQYVHSRTHSDSAAAPARTDTIRYAIPDILRLKANCDQAQKLLENVAHGMCTFGALADIDRLTKAIASEAMKLHQSGVLDRIEAWMFEEQKENRP